MSWPTRWITSRSASVVFGKSLSFSQWLLIGLANRSGQAMSPAQIQKAMFLMRMEAEPYS
jgi:hypothetical protein